MRLIDADKIIKEVYENPFVTDSVKTYVKCSVVEQPTVDAVEVVRCKDCKHRHLDGMTWNCPFGLSGGEDFFCAYGAKDGDSDD